MTAGPITVVVACFSSERWPGLRRAIESIRNQTYSAVPIVVVDYNEELYRALVEWSPPGVTLLRNTRQRGASGARNTGAAAAATEFIAFLDDDAVAAPSWLAELAAAMTDPRTVGVGGAIAPAWQGHRPWWFPGEFGWVVGATSPVPPQQRRRVRNVWAGNMLVRRDIFLSVGGFREGFGKAGRTHEPEDTDLCIRMAAAAEGGAWLSIGGALVWHEVPETRATPGFFVRRCWAEGKGKAALVCAVGDSGTALSAERQYLRSVLPRAVARDARAAATGDLTGLCQAAMIITGTVTSGLGYALARRR